MPGELGDQSSVFGQVVGLIFFTIVVLCMVISILYLYYKMSSVGQICDRRMTELENKFDNLLSVITATLPN